MYNTILVKCPKCGERVEFQTKSGSCILNDYAFEAAPKDELEGIVGDSWICKCGHIIKIQKKEDKEVDDKFRESLIIQ